MKKPLPSIPLRHRTWHCDATNTDFTYRTWTLGEQSLLLEVQDEETNVTDWMDTLIQVIEACVIKPENVDLRNVPMFVVESLFLRIYSASVNSVHTMGFICQNKVEDEKVCGSRVQFDVPIDELQIKTSENHSDTINLEGGYHIKMKYANYAMRDVKPPAKVTAEWVISQFLETIYTDDGEVWDLKEYTSEELAEFVAGLGTECQSQILNDFFHGTPKIYWEAGKTCPGCGYKHKLVINGIRQLFQ